MYVKLKNKIVINSENTQKHKISVKQMVKLSISLNADSSYVLKLKMDYLKNRQTIYYIYLYKKLYLLLITHTHTPVSYTHLDVYKRQHTHCKFFF